LTPMDSLVLCMKESPARRSFKKISGQNNHFLITIHVGLAAVQDGTITVPSDIHLAWDPRDRVSSASRNRGFANKTALAWLVNTPSSSSGLRAVSRRSTSTPGIAPAGTQDQASSRSTTTSRALTCRTRHSSRASRSPLGLERQPRGYEGVAEANVIDHLITRSPSLTGHLLPGTRPLRAGITCRPQSGAVGGWVSVTILSAR
jgi:hypothetical protein